MHESESSTKGFGRAMGNRLARDAESVQATNVHSGTCERLQSANAKERRTMATETNDTNTNETNANEPKAKAKANAKAQPKSYTIGQIAVMRAKATNKDTSRAAKEVRSRLRANFDKACKLQPSLSKAKTNANDGNRWPMISQRVVDELNLTTTRK